MFFETTDFASNACALYGRKIRYVRKPKGFFRSDVYAVRADKGLRPLINPGVFRQSPAEKQSFSAVFLPSAQNLPLSGAAAQRRFVAQRRLPCDFWDLCRIKYNSIVMGVGLVRIIVLKKRTLVFLVAALLCVLAAVLCLLLLPDGDNPSAFTSAGTVNRIAEYELNVLAGKKRELPVYSVERSDKKIALTIDAAWEDDKTEFILETLEQFNVKATFFLCGVWVEAYPEQVKRIAEKGHEIGNHSLTHPHMNKLAAAGVQQEISKLDDEIERLTGKRCTLFRAPFGEYNDTVITAVREIGYEPIQWNIDTIDWKEERSADTILNTVLPKLAPGSIILCHNNGYKIKEYLPRLLETALAEGYEFVTVSELLLTGDTTIDPNGVQKLI